MKVLLLMSAVSMAWADDEVMLLQVQVDLRDRWSPAHQDLLWVFDEASGVARDPTYKTTCVLGIVLLMVYALPQLKAWTEKPKVPPAESAVFETLTSKAGSAGDELEQGMLCGPALCKEFAAGSVEALFRQRVREKPNGQAIADVLASVDITYQELDNKISAMADALIASGLGEGDAVALLLPPSLQMIVATFACMRAKVAWVPMDAQAPVSRLNVQIVVVHAGMAIVPAGFVRLDELAALLPTQSISAAGEFFAAPEMSARHAISLPAGIAAIFFTSGSTGVPKAVMYGHDTVLHGVLSMVQLCNMDESTRLLVKTPSVWAVCEYELFAALVVGGVAVVDSSCQQNVQNFAQSLVQHKVSVAMTSAPVLQLLAEELDGIKHSLQHVVNVGAAMPVQVCVEAQNSLGCDLQVHNIYGCTETPCTQWTFSTTTGVPATALPKLCPAGRPQPGVEVYVVDELLQPVPFGEKGEICFGGSFLSKGYFNDVPGTQKRFRASPTGRGLIYCTGDVGCWIQDPALPHEGTGTAILQIVGRKDRQLNVNGVRVAPEEVEALLVKAPHVQEAAVVQVGEDSSAAMVACVACTSSGDQSETGLLEYCEKHYAKHLRPKKFILMEKLPKLPNGKVDLKACEENAKKGDSTIVLDSLGMMRSMAPSQVRAKHVADNVVAMSTLGMVFFHTFQTAGARIGDDTSWVHSGSCFEVSWLRTLAIDWREASEWASYGFVFAGAYMDAMSPDRFTYGIREVVIFYTWLIACAIHQLIAPDWGGSSFWYLLMLLQAKFILVSCHRLKIPVALQTFIFMAVPLLKPLLGYINQSYEMFSGERVTKAFALSPLLVDLYKQEELMCYGMTFLLIPELMKRTFAWKQRTLSKDAYASTVLCFVMLVCFTVTAVGSARQFPKLFWRSLPDPFYADDFIVAFLVFACVFCPSSIQFKLIAQNALGSYVSSCLFYYSSTWKHQSVFWVGLSNAVGGGDGGAVVQLIALVTLTVAWVCLVGPITQWVMLLPIKAYRYTTGAM